MTKSQPQITLEWVHASQRNLARLLPAVLKRIGEFTDKYDGDAIPDLQVVFLATQSWQQKPEQVIIAAVSGDKVVGHMVAAVEMYFGSAFVVITQLEVDKDVKLLRSTFDRGMELIDQWARSLGITKQRIWARNEAVSRVFTRYGFKDTGRVLMEREVPALTAPAPVTEEVSPQAEEPEP